MARFEMQLPTEVIKDIEKVEGNYEKIFGGMTKAGAELVYKNVKANMPKSLRESNFNNCIAITRTYRTPSDDGINTKVIIRGYFKNSNGKRTPAPLVANVFEYGRSNSSFPKQPFFRKSFSKRAIRIAMEKAQEELSGGLLKDE